MKEYKVGDDVWYFKRGLVIKCKILSIDTWAREIHPNGFLFYWLDEPIGHALGIDEFFSTKEEAIEHAKEWKKDCIEYEQEVKLDQTLDNSRRNSLNFIVGTWEIKPCDEAFNKMLEEYPDKEQGKDWFNLNDLDIGLSIEKVEGINYVYKGVENIGYLYEISEGSSFYFLKHASIKEQIEILVELEKVLDVRNSIRNETKY